MWEKILVPLNKFEVASEKDLGIVGILKHIEASIRKYVPKEWGISPHLKISNLTRENLRKIITAFIATGEGTHAAPFYRQGAGTINLLVLAMLSMIAEEKQNVIFAMEEVETAIPPYTQKRVVHEIRKLSAQSFLTSHSPYVLEEFDMGDTCMLNRASHGSMMRVNIEMPEGIKSKKYKQDFRTKFSEGLLARRVLIAEGFTEAIAIPAVSRKLSELNEKEYIPLEALGICTINAEGDGSVLALCKLFKSLGKEVFALCDLQEEGAKKLIEGHADKLFMHPETGFEKMVMKNVAKSAITRFAASVELPPHIKSKHPKPLVNPDEALSEYFIWSKGWGGITDFLVECTEAELPVWLKDSCKELRSICQPAEKVVAKES
jgi:putative ATP-dependent endonuclease of OLD family